MDKNGEKKVCVIGVGYVGEHLMSIFKERYDVMGIDVSPKRIKELRAKYPGIKFEDRYIASRCCNVFMICVPTLLAEDKSIDITPLANVKNELEKFIAPGSIVIVESSVNVGCTRKMFGDWRSKGIFVGFSPERIDPGRSYPLVQDIPKIISGIDSDSLLEIDDIYKAVFKNVVKVSSVECAEMTKLYENCFRMVNIAYVNEIDDMCKAMGIDSKEMIGAASTKPFGFMPFTPGLGVGGHCIPVNPYYLFKDYSLPVLETSTKLMEMRPINKAKELTKKYPRVFNALLIGIGFKKGAAVIDNSPGYALYKELCEKWNITVYDPLVQMNGSTDNIKFLCTENFNQTYLKKFEVIIVNYVNNKSEEEIYKGLSNVTYL